MSTFYIESPRKNIYEFILSTNTYSFEAFTSKIRYEIKQSLKNYSFKRPSIEDLKHYGLIINKQTVNRQLRKEDVMTVEKFWNDYIMTIYSNNEFIIIGAYRKDAMVGYVTVYELEGRYNFLHAYIDRETSGNISPMRGLIYVLINQLIEQYGAIKISYGLDIFDSLPKLNSFKRSMLFEQVPSTRGYLIHPFLLIFFKLIVSFYIRLLKRKNIGNPYVRTILRLYQGSRILDNELKNTQLPA